VNAVGDVIDPFNGAVVAGARDASGKLADARTVLRAGAQTTTPRPGENTTIGVVATNAKLTRAQASRMALMADDGLARALFPSHTLGDGGTVLRWQTAAGTGNADVSNVGALAADVMAKRLFAPR
jgi:L-aminopeptidase/D-esterase-like protein